MPAPSPSALTCWARLLPQALWPLSRSTACRPAQRTAWPSALQTRPAIPYSIQFLAPFATTILNPIPGPILGPIGRPDPVCEPTSAPGPISGPIRDPLPIHEPIRNPQAEAQGLGSPTQNPANLRQTYQVPVKFVCTPARSSRHRNPASAASGNRRLDRQPGPARSERLVHLVCARQSHLHHRHPGSQ